MIQAKKERLSVLMDDELDAPELDPVLRDLSADGDLRAAWDRWHLIGDVLRGEPVSRDVMQVAARVRERLADEPTVLAPPRPAPRRWMLPLAGSAMAASIALVAVLGGYVQVPGLESADPAVRVRVVQNAEPAALYQDRTGTYWSLRRPEVESKLNGYLVNHREYAPVAGMKGMLPYATLAGYDAR